MRALNFHLCLLSAFTVVSGCGGGGRATNIARRASFDLGCEVTPDQVQSLTRGAYGIAREYGVIACGCRATYVVADQSFVLNVVSGEECHVTAGGQAPQRR